MPTLLITGANRGIGLEFTRSFAADGWRVHACCRQPDKAKELQALAERASDAVLVHRLDVTDDLRVENLARELADEPIDLLLNNAGIYGPRGGLEEADFEEWLPVFAINTIAPVRMVAHFAGHIARSQRKLIVNITSRMGSIAENGSGGSYAYRASKTGLNMMAKSLSIDLESRGITVIVMHPGWVQTDMGGQNAQISPEESVGAMRKVIDGLGRKDNGRFFNYDGGELPW